VTPEVKKSLLGPAGKILAGGAIGEASPQWKDVQGREPVNYHGMPGLFYSELLHSFELDCVMNGTEMDGEFALQCIKAKKAYIGVCLTEKHAELIRDQMIRQVWKEFTSPKSVLHKAALSPSCNKVLRRRLKP